MLTKVNIKVSNKRLQLTFSHQGQRHYFSLGYPDNELGRDYAQLMANKIQEDILKGRFTGLEQYKNLTSNQYKSLPAATIAELWPAYLDYLRPLRSPSTMGAYSGWQTRSIKRCPYDLDQAPKIRDWALKHHTPDSAKRLLTSLNACCKWAISSELLTYNPMKNIKIDLPKQYQQREINPFNADERDRILTLLASNPKWDYYQPLISFLFFTGCRLSEAIALEWSHVASDGQHLTFEQAAVSDELGRRRIKPGLKRQQTRKIPLSDRVRKCLGTRHTGLVFPAPRTGGLLDLNNCARRIWKPALIAAELDYRNLYQCRHTFITLALRGTDTRKPLTVQDVAKLVGNSPEIIYRCYAGTTADLALPDW